MARPILRVTLQPGEPGQAMQATLKALMRRLGGWRLAIILLLNLIPVAGVVILGWDAASILMLYWVENLIIGATAFVRIVTARGVAGNASPAGLGGRLFIGAFFLVHYGIFCLVHGAFAALIATDGALDRNALLAQVFADRGFRIAVLAAAVLQIVSLVRDWWTTGLWRRSAPNTEMFRPYGRIVVLHVTVIFGAWALGALDAPSGAVLVLCLAKTVLELAVAAWSSEGRTAGARI